MGKGAALSWTYTLCCWALPYQPCPGPLMLARAQVAAGEPWPETVKAQRRPGCGYAVCIDFAQALLRR